MNVILFEDDRATALYPVTVGRAAFHISCGSYRLIDLVGQLGQLVACLVRPHLRGVQQADYPHLSSAHLDRRAPVLLVNAALVPSVESLARLKTTLDARQTVAIRTKGRLAAALLPAGSPIPPDDLGGKSLDDWLRPYQPSAAEIELPLFEYPHEILLYHLETLKANLAHRLSCGTYEEIAASVFAARGAQLGAHVVTDTQAGPIVLEENARIGPYCYLSGPAHVGRAARVIEHAAIKDGVALGHTTKIGGEVEASVIEPYTNKQHHGFLGHSYLGSWINLGAGTCNSDLKNTYGLVNMEYGGRKVSTGMQFIGCIIGDYAKTAINTGIFTGKTIGVCSMVYGFVTTNVPSFVNYARSFGQVTETPADVMIATQARMFARRDVPQRPCDMQLLIDMFELTRSERQLAGEPLSL